MVLLRSAPAEEARAAAGHNKTQWARFNMFTRDQAKELLKSSPDRTWAKVPANQKATVKREINALLVEEEIAEVHDDVLDWRMSACMKGLIRAAKPTPPGWAPTASGNATITQPVRNFDPIRDI